MADHFLNCTLLTCIQLQFTWTPFLLVWTQSLDKVSVFSSIGVHEAPISPFPQPNKAHCGSTYPTVYLANQYFTSLATRIPRVYSRYCLLSNDPEFEESECKQLFVQAFCLWNISSGGNYILKLDIDAINYSSHMLKKKMWWFSEGCSFKVSHCSKIFRWLISNICNYLKNNLPKVFHM